MSLKRSAAAPPRRADAAAQTTRRQTGSDPPWWQRRRQQQWQVRGGECGWQSRQHQASGQRQSVRRRRRMQLCSRERGARAGVRVHPRSTIASLRSVFPGLVLCTAVVCALCTLGAEFAVRSDSIETLRIDSANGARAVRLSNHRSATGPASSALKWAGAMERKKNNAASSLSLCGHSSATARNGERKAMRTCNSDTTVRQHYTRATNRRPHRRQQLPLLLRRLLLPRHSPFTSHRPLSVYSSPPRSLCTSSSWPANTY